MKQALLEFLNEMDKMVPTCVRCLDTVKTTEERIHRITIVFAYDMAYVNMIPLTEPVMCFEFYVKPEFIKESTHFDFAEKYTCDDQFDINWFVEEFVKNLEE